MASSSTCVGKSLHGHDPIITTVALSLHSSPSTLQFPNSINKSISVRQCSGTATLLSFKTRVSFFPAFLFFNKIKDAKAELLQAIEPLDRGADATPQDQNTIDQLTRKLEAVNPTKEPLKSDLLNGKWELIYTTSKSILQNERPKFLRSRVNYQAINLDTLRAQNMETWPFFNQVTANLFPVNSRKVEVRFDYFRILGLIPVKAPERRELSMALWRLLTWMRI